MATILVRHILSDSDETDFAGMFNIRTLSSLVSDGEMVQQLHRHSHFYILVLDRAAGQHSIDFIHYPVSDHTIFFVRPGQVHALTLQRGATGFLIQFGKNFYLPSEQPAIQTFRKVSTKSHCVVKSGRFDKMLAIVKNIFQEYDTREHGYQQVMRNCLENFFIELSRQSRNPAKHANPANGYMQDRLEEMIELMETYISTHKEVSYYADTLNISTYQLNAATRTLLGKTCSEVINDHIVLTAKRYLLATSDQINQIAWHLGYEDVSYFIRFFRKHTGFTPELFRRNFA